MNINIENYKEYFLLYADNELTPGQKKIVDMFVKSNPQLKQEFNGILATVQTPAAIEFSYKSSLLKNDKDAFIDLSNYESRFIEYHDGELGNIQKLFVEDFISEHKELKKAFEQIGLCKTEPDLSVHFTDKESLYHKPAGVVSAFFFRTAVAAAILGFLVWAGYKTIYHSQSEVQTQLATAQTREEPGQPETHTIPPVKQQKSDLKNNHREQEVSTTNEKVSYPRTNHSKTTIRENNYINKVDVTQKELKAVSAITDATPLQEIAHNLPGIAGHIETKQNLNLHPISTREISSPSSSEKNLAASSGKSETKYLVIPGDEANSNYVLTDIPAEKIRQSKFGVFIKKVKRTIDRTNPINRLLNGDDD